MSVQTTTTTTDDKMREDKFCSEYNVSEKFRVEEVSRNSNFRSQIVPIFVDDFRIKSFLPGSLVPYRMGVVKIRETIDSHIFGKPKENL